LSMSSMVSPATAESAAKSAKTMEKLREVSPYNFSFVNSINLVIILAMLRLH
jgi:hypothetical protein